MKNLIFGITLLLSMASCNSQTVKSSDTHYADSKPRVIILKPIVSYPDDSLVQSQIDTTVVYAEKRVKQSMPREMENPNKAQKNMSTFFWKFFDSVGYNLESTISLYFTEILLYVTIDRVPDIEVFPVIEESLKTKGQLIEIADKYDADFVISLPQVTFSLNDSLVECSSDFILFNVAKNEFVSNENFGMYPLGERDKGYFSCGQNHISCSFTQPLEQALIKCIYILTGDEDAKEN